MNIIIGMIWLVTAVAGYYALLLYNMHMFQLNSYMPDEQKRFMRDHRGSLLGRIMGILISIPLLLFGKRVGMILACVLNVLTFWGNRPWARKAKRPLVYTARVKRLLITIHVIYALLAGLQVWFMFLSIGKNRIQADFLSVVNPFWLLFPVAVVFMPYLMFLANSINHPIEEGINNKYINEAKQMIRDMPDLKVIGITGSFGKTSMKYFLTKLLSGSYRVLMTPGNYNTVLGVTKTIREQLKATHEIFVCEMGARRVGEIKGVCDIVSPDYGIVTSIGAQHLETFGSMENIIHTKLELVDALGTTGCAFFNVDNEILEKQKTPCPMVTYGLENKKATFCPLNVKVTDKGSEFDMRFPDAAQQTAHFVTPLIGTHNVLNLAGAIACAYELKVPVEVMQAQAKRLEAVPHRLQMIKSPRGIIIDDAYNSNPSGAKAAMETLSMFDGIRFLVTPGMVELGAKQEELNETLGRQAAGYADYIVLVGQKQTEPISRGVRSMGFPEDRLWIVSDLQEGMAKIDAVRGMGRQKIILLENDLPDNY